MPSDQHNHVVNISDVERMTVGELFRRIADHEKQYIDQLKADALKREEERQKEARNGPGKKRGKRT